MATADEGTAVDRLTAAARDHHPCPPVRDLIGPADGRAAYRVQTAVNARRAATTGVHPVGRKIGLTSPAVQRQLGVGQPDYGVLFSDMRYEPAGRADPATLLQPRIEAEVAFVLSRDVDEAVTADSVAGHVELAFAALEIVDSRIAGWDISLADTIADNASSGGYVVAASGVDLGGVDLAAVRMSMTENGSVVSAGAGSDCMGSPLEALAWLANTSRELGSPLRAGEVVLSGALGPMVPVRPGAVYAATISDVGHVEITFTGGTP
jgi:2-keto-4-pentenoate hydratase